MFQTLFRVKNVNSHFFLQATCSSTEATQVSCSILNIHKIIKLITLHAQCEYRYEIISTLDHIIKIEYVIEIDFFFFFVMFIVPLFRFDALSGNK